MNMLIALAVVLEERISGRCIGPFIADARDRALCQALLLFTRFSSHREEDNFTLPRNHERGNTTVIETTFLHFFTVVALTAHQKRNSPSNSGYLHSTHPAFQYATTPGATLAQQSGKPYFKEK